MVLQVSQKAVCPFSHCWCSTTPSLGNLTEETHSSRHEQSCSRCMLLHNVQGVLQAQARPVPGRLSVCPGRLIDELISLQAKPGLSIPRGKLHTLFCIASCMLCLAQGERCCQSLPVSVRRRSRAKALLPPASYFAKLPVPLHNAVTFSAGALSHRASSARSFCGRIST